MGNPVVLVYSHRADIREQIMLAVGRRPAPDLGRIEFLECESVSDVLMAVDGHQADLAILDGEAQPTGGMGISRQIHMEVQAPPPVVLVVRRADDRWLATWSKAEAVIIYPLDPVTAAATVADVLRRVPVVSRPAH
jgi:DNA-binding response OmpR family regulator